MKKVCIVGLGNGRDSTPYDDKNYEIWGLNDGYAVMKRINRLFEIHNEQHTKTFKNRFTGLSHEECMADLNIPIYMQRFNDTVPFSIEFPVKRLLKMYRHSFAGTVDYMICLAIDEKFDEIKLCGVELVQAEYASQLPSLAYWVGFARGLELKVDTGERLQRQIDDHAKSEYEEGLREGGNKDFFFQKSIYEHNVKMNYGYDY